MKNKTTVSVICIVLAIMMAFSLVISILGSVSAYAVSQSQIDALEDQKSGLRAQTRLRRPRPGFWNRKPPLTSEMS